jgi:hypothetical protein
MISRSKDGLKHRGTESTEIAENGKIAELVGVGWLRFRSEVCGLIVRTGMGCGWLPGRLVAAGSGTGIEKG